MGWPWTGPNAMTTSASPFLGSWPIPSCIPRPYVDDLTSDGQHDDDDLGVALASEAVTTMVTVVQAYALAWELVMNAKWSVLL